MFNSFDDLDQHLKESSNIKIVPYFVVEHKNDEEKFCWLKDTLIELVDRAEDRIRCVNTNYKFYKGQVLLGDRTYREDDVSEITDRSKDTKLYVNYIRKLLEENVNRLLEIKPNVEVLPVHNEETDKIGSKLGKVILDSVWYEINIDKVVRQATNASKIAGSHYIGVFWDPEKGKIDRDVKEALKEKSRIPILDDDGNEIEGAFIDRAPAEGDIVYEQIDTRKVLCEPITTGEWDDVNYVMVLRVEYRDVLKRRYPGKEKFLGKFNPVDAGISYISQDEIDRLNREGKTLTITLYHKPTIDLPKGKEIVFTIDGILEESDHKYSHDKLPLIRRTDVDVPGELQAESFMEDVKGLQIQYFALTSGILANQKLFAYPKWFVPHSAGINPQSLANGRGILKYKGQVPPSVYSPSPTPAEIFNTRDGFREEMRYLATGSENTPGTPPPGITAGVALQFLQEQDLKRFNTDLAKHFDMIKELGQLTLSVCGQYMTKDHSRMERVVGNNDIHALRDLAKVDLNGPYDVRISQSSGLPDTKAARVQTIMDLAGHFEGLFTREQLLDALDLGDANKMFDQATAAVKAAEAIVEDILQGIAVTEPQLFENLIVHWKVIITRMQQRDFKERVSVERREALIDYLRAVEMLMLEKAESNPRFQEEVLQLSLFPAAYVIPPPPPPPPIPGEIPEGAPAGQAILDPREVDGSGMADPGQSMMIGERSDSGSGQY